MICSCSFKRKCQAKHRRVLIFSLAAVPKAIMIAYLMYRCGLGTNCPMSLPAKILRTENPLLQYKARDMTKPCLVVFWLSCFCHSFPLGVDSFVTQWCPPQDGKFTFLSALKGTYLHGISKSAGFLALHLFFRMLFRPICITHICPVVMIFKCADYSRLATKQLQRCKVSWERDIYIYQLTKLHLGIQIAWLWGDDRMTAKMRTLLKKMRLVGVEVAEQFAALIITMYLRSFQPLF